MRHVSAHQLVFWPRHVLTEASTATGILHPPQTDDCPRGMAKDDHAREGSRTKKTSRAKIKARPSPGRCTSTSD
jgi:hypothetical protein